MFALFPIWFSFTHKIMLDLLVINIGWFPAFMPLVLICEATSWGRSSEPWLFYQPESCGK